MKKTFLLIGCLVVLTLGIVAISCSKNGTTYGGYNVKTCLCKLSGNIPDEIPAEAREFEVPIAAGPYVGVNSCSELQSMLKENYDDDINVKCN